MRGATPFSGWSSGFAPASVNGGWSFEAYTPNTFPDSTNWSIAAADFGFNASLFPASTSVGIGASLATPISEGEIQWYDIAHAGGTIEFSTAGSTISELDGDIQTADTLIALFDATGTLVEFNDDASERGADEDYKLAEYERTLAGELTVVWDLERDLPVSVVGELEGTAAYEVEWTLSVEAMELELAASGESEDTVQIEAAFTVE